jgi:hypothetical protein
MNEQTVQMVIGCLERLLQHVGIQTLEEAGAALQRIADILMQAKPFCNRERLSEWLRKNELGAEDEMLIRGISEGFPAVAVALLEEVLPVMRKEFPVSNAGRPKSLTSEQARGVCAYVGKLYTEGLDIKTAKKRAAQKFDVSVSTIERAWAERKKGHKPSPKEILGILKSKQINQPKALPAEKENASSSIRASRAKAAAARS